MTQAAVIGWGLGDAPPAPASGYVVTYFNAAGEFYKKDSAGQVSPIGVSLAGLTTGVVKHTSGALSIATGADLPVMTATVGGAVPTPPNDATKILRGNGTWGSASGGLTNFADSVFTAAPNATIPVVSLTATNAATNVDVAIVPKGTGSFSLRVPDNLASGGNKRGIFSVDLQLYRSSETQVAGGRGSFLVGENNAIASGSDYSFCAGSGNTLSGTNAVCFGAGNTVSNASASITAGQNNYVNGGAATFGTGNSNSGGFGVVAGSSNQNYATRGVVLGDSNTAEGTWSITLGVGNNNSAQSGFVHGSYGRSFGIQGKYIHANASTLGTNQAGRLILRGSCAINATAVLTADAGTASIANSVANIQVLQNNQAIAFKGLVTARKAGGGSYAWEFNGLIERIGNAASTVLRASSITAIGGNIDAGTITLSANTSFGCLQIQVAAGAVDAKSYNCVLYTSELM